MSSPPMSPSPPGIDPSEEMSDLAFDAPGVDEVAFVAWPLLWRRRFHERVGRSPRYAWYVLSASLFGLFSVGFTITVLTVSIPSIAADLGSSTSTLTWVITGPMLAYAVVGPAAGKLGDLWGSRRVYLLSLGAVTLFAGLTALAWSAFALIAFRVLGAAMGAATGPSSLAMINRHFPPERRAQALGYWSLVAAGGPVIGVVAGGPIVEAYGWRWIFVAQVPMTLVALLVGAGVLRETERHERTPFDLAGSVLLGGGVGALLWALNRGPVVGWASPIVVVGFVLCPLLLAWFVVVELRSSHPLIPMRYLRERNFAFPILNQYFANFAYMGGFMLTPFLLQEVLGYGQSKTGLLSIARPLTFAIAGPIAGYLATRVGERASAVAGSLMLVVSMLGLALVGVGSSDLLIVGALAIAGAGMGTVAPSMAASIANAVDERDLGVVGASQQMVAQVGVVSGIQIMLTVQASSEAESGAAGSYHLAYLVGAGVAVVAVVMAAFVRSTKRDPAPTPA